MRILGVIPARGGSKGIPRKNIKLMNGKPMIQYTIEAAQKSALDHVVVSTEDEEIKTVCEGLGAEVLDRPEELADDKVHTEQVLLDVLKKVEGYDAVALLQPTSPLRSEFYINEAVDISKRGKFNSVMSVYMFPHFVWVLGLQCPYPMNYDPKGRRPRRQNKPPEFLENGAIYIIKTEIFLKTEWLISGRLGLYVMPDEASIQVATPYDFFMAEQTMKYYDQDDKGNWHKS